MFWASKIMGEVMKLMQEDKLNLIFIVLYVIFGVVGVVFGVMGIVNLFS
jgi:hypothetical protein